MLQQISYFLLSTISDLIIIVVLLRLFLQLARANFRNPLAQAIVQLTSPLVVPVRRFIPAIGRIDTATLLVAYVLKVVFIAAILLVMGGTLSSNIFVAAIIALILLSLRLFFFAILIQIVLSWIAPGTYNPATSLVDELVQPVLAPFRRIIPPIAGLDLSPLAAIIALQVGMIIVANISI